MSDKSKKLAIKAEKREVFGKALSEARLRGELPAVIYGPKEETTPVFVPFGAFKKIWHEAGESTLIELNIDGAKKDVLIHDVDIDPIKSFPRHVDFYAVDLTKKLIASVALVFEGEAPAVKLGGILVKVMREVEVETLPKDLPHEIKVDVSSLESFEDRITIADLKLPKGVSTVAEPEEVVVLAEAPKSEEAPAEEAASLADIEIVGRREKKDEEIEEEVEEKKEEKK
ncbi:MAG: 50S ribosomal protein L25 [bacterium]|nr:50S ribosomal protein L25 [bacterium]